MENLDWLKDIDIEPLLHGDAKLVYERCGRETVIKLWKSLMGIYIHISEELIWDARREYVRKNFKGNNHKELAATLQVSQRWIYDFLKEESKVKTIKPTQQLFLLD